MKRSSIMSLFISAAILVSAHAPAAAQSGKPLRLAVAGLSHGHLGEVVSKLDRGDFVVVGAWESDPVVRKENGLAGRLDPSLVFSDLGKMLDKTKPEAVIAYGSIYDHLAVVEACAPRGIHVMVEKPLAVNTEHAERMAKLAQDNCILLLTNYETTWYASNHEAYRLTGVDGIGDITRINVYDGHQGPIEIGCGPHFLAWLTDPVLNGGGAVIDFGCYGANLATWLMKGEKPLSVYAVLNHQKPAVYPLVDDDATIVLEYPGEVTVQIMASWNWPMSRKDMHIYGSKGYIYQDNATQMRVCTNGKEEAVRAPALEAPYNDSFLYLKAAVRGDIKIGPADLSALENNLTVVEILTAAIKSSQTGIQVILPR